MASIYDLQVERRFQLLVDAVVDYAIFLLDSEGNIASWNTGAERIKGYRADEIIGSHFSAFYSAEDRERGVPARSLRSAAEKGKFEAEGWRYRKDGSRFWASVVIDAVHSEKGAIIGFAKVTRDITERKQFEQQLLQAREQLLQAQKMESIGQLTGGIAHDFNNLLTVILSGSQMMERLAQGNEQLLRLIGHIRHSVERGERLTRQLLAYSRRQSLKPQLLDLSQSLHSFCDGILQTLRGNIEMDIDIPRDLWPVEADPNELELALINIALNARDAMQSGGQMRVRVRNDFTSLDQAGGARHYVAISISDTGMGMAPETLARATEPFFTTKPLGAGTGLGLSQAFGFAKQSGGNLHIDSAWGKGTTVTIHLPAAQSSRSNPATAARSSGGITVLVVEDEVLVADMAKSILLGAGYNVELAHEAGTALDILRSTKVDVVFTDIVMPGGMNGLELARKLETERPDIRVLLTTGYFRIPESDLARHRVLRKPYDETALLAALEGTLKSKGAEPVAAF
jgi:PAS domain S-box-containing protein